MAISVRVYMCVYIGNFLVENLKVALKEKQRKQAKLIKRRRKKSRKKCEVRVAFEEIVKSWQGMQFNKELKGSCMFTSF